MSALQSNRLADIIRGLPSLFDIFFGRLARWIRQIAAWRKQGLLKKALQVRRRERMRLESLEPRLLLSADPMHLATAGSAVDRAFVPLGEDAADFDASNTVLYENDTGTAGILGDSGVAIVIDFNGVPSGGTDATTADAPISDAMREGTTLSEIRGQTVFLSFDGGGTVNYNGPVHVSDIEIVGFDAPTELHGRDAEIEAAILGMLEQSFAGSEVAFTTLQPTAGDFSTIFIGGRGEAFSAYGSFYGLAEKIDVGNVDRNDIAFVFSDNISAAGRDAAEYGALLAGYAAHELGHLLGFEHAHSVETGSPLASVAFDPKVHVAIGEDARADAIDDGSVTIDGQNYRVHPKLVAALTDWLPYYNAGAVGGDAFPDVVMGQFAIHPVEHGVWLTRVLDMAWAAQNDPWFTDAEKGQILAWSYGLLTHSAGDHFSHSLVNQFAEGVAPGFVAAVEDSRDLGNMLRHFMTEAYIADAMEGVDTNPDVTLLPDGDYSNVSTPGIDFAAPVRFIYEALIRPFPQDPTAIVEAKLGNDDVLTIDAATKTINRTTGSFVENGFKVGHKITTSGFSSSANNGVFHITAVTALSLTVSETLAAGDSLASAANGDETIKVFVPFTQQTAITVNDATNSFVRQTGSFKDDGFVQGQRFTIYGSHNYQGDYIVKSLSEDGKTLTVYEDLHEGFEVGNGDEMLVVQGSRGPILDKIFELQDKLELAAIGRGPRQDFAQLLLQYAAAQIDPLVTAPSNEQLLGAYFYNWVEDIDAAVQNWGEVGLAFAKAMWDAQSKRDLQNIVGAETGQTDLPANTIRRDAEANVGVIDVFFRELDDPNNDDDHSDGYINRYLLPAIGLPDFTGDVREALGDVAAFLDALVAPIVEPIQAFFLPIQEAIVDFEDSIKTYLGEQIEKRFGVSVDIFEFLKELSSKMDLASIDVGTLLNVPIFKPGDHELLDAYLGMTPADHHEDVPAGLHLIPFATFFADAEGRLTDGLTDEAHFSKTAFAAYANSVTLTKLLYLMETPPDGSTEGAGQLSVLYSDLSGTVYDFTLLNMHGAHGGNVLTTTLPGVGGEEPWMDSIDADQMWRQDSFTTTTALFRVSTQNDTASPAVWQGTVVAGETYRVYATWQANVTQRFDNLDNSAHPDQPLSPASNAQYTIKDNGVAFAIGQPVAVDQRQYAGDPDYTIVEDGGLAFRLLGEYTFTSTTVNVELGNLADGHVIAGPILLERVSGGARNRLELARDATTFAQTDLTAYTDDDTSWTDLVYPSSTGNNPLWESALLRPGFRTLFVDWLNEGPIRFPDLGDPTSPDRNTVPSIAKTQLPSFATPFTPFAPEADIEFSILGAANLTLRFVEKTPGGADWLQLVKTSDPTTIFGEYLIGSDKVLSVNIHPDIDFGSITIGGQFADTLTLDLGFSGTLDPGDRPSLYITFDGADELLPNDLTTVRDVLHVVNTGPTTFTLQALDIDSTEAVEVDGDITVLGELSIDVRATDAAQYSALIDLVHARSTASIDVLGGNIQAGTVYLTAVSTQILDVAGFELGGFQIGILNSISEARVSVQNDSRITTTAGGITLGATSPVLAHNVLASNPGGDADTDAAVASTTVFTDAFARLAGTAELDSAGEVTITAGNSVDSKAIADGSAGGAGATLGFSLVLADTEASISGYATVDATSIHLTANSDFDLDVMAKATPGGATDSKAKEVKFDPSTKVNAAADTIDLVAGHGLEDGDRVVYRHGTGIIATNVGGLEDGKAYFVRVDEATNKIKLFDTKDQAKAADTEAAGLRDLNTTLTFGSEHSVKKTSLGQSVLADPNKDGNTADKAATSDGDVEFGAAIAA
ncbi:MAG: LEPR-XLL domain-containing protein, partial [Rhodospirillaceae bacterium]|nr:LEPR-XLL domain-containing protein [Rhodospirillaceae bacterium]